ncbi:uncharacterized protein LOC144437416 [Glandiceps talaboti]
MSAYLWLLSFTFISSINFSGCSVITDRSGSDDDENYLEIEQMNPDPLRPSFDDLPPIMRKYSIPKPMRAHDSHASPILEPKSAMEVILERNEDLIAANVPELFQGDMYFGPLKQRGAIAREERYWPDGIVPYVIDPVFNAESVGRIKNAMEDFRVFSCVRFVERTYQEHYVYITALDGCWSGTGYGRFAGQKISLGNGCLFHSTIVHELMHTLGFFHEQMRRDRDNYVTIYWDNILDYYEGQFSKIYEKSTTQGTPYDYDSIMHYNRKAFTKDGSPTIVAINDFNRKLGSTLSFSKWDFVELNGLYNCGYDVDIWYRNQKECLTDTNLRRRGADMNDGSKDRLFSLEECCNLCKRTHGCKAFSWDKESNSRSTLKDCWLQSDWVQGWTDQSYDSGIIWPWPEEDGDDEDDEGDGGQIECIDKNESCKGWANIGECEKNPDYMLPNCAKSCKPECDTDDECIDSHDSCATWAEQGECEKNKLWMLPNCKRSCTQCDECVDSHDSCATWAEQGECEKNKVWMLPNCKRSCNQCDKNGPDTTNVSKWRDDLRCGPAFPLSDGSPAQCNPNGIYPCCSSASWCGNTAGHCSCAGCTDYRGKL